jgi:glycosyltransferase involved in cell wall biosynthesis
MRMEFSRVMSHDAQPQTTPGDRWPLMVLAHNEERRIAACLDSVFAGEPERRLEVFVMANGCSDRTEDIVREYARRRGEVRLVSLALGDKCNAWNHFIHEVVAAEAPGRQAYFFMDGDARIVPGSLGHLAEALVREPAAHAASAPPASGRSMARDRRELIEGRHLVANLYALRGSFVEALRGKGVRLPLGLEGDDGLLGALIKWDLDPRANDFDSRRIVPCADAGFLFDSVSVLSPREWRGYWRRLVRYGRRRYEFQLLGRRLKRDGLRGLPVHISDLYQDAGTLPLTWNGLYTLPNWIALRDLRRHAARKASA